MKVSFMGLLAILFIGLKLGGVIAWSWWWVLSPIWIGFALIVPVLILAAWLHSGDEQRAHKWRR